MATMNDLINENGDNTPKYRTSPVNLGDMTNIRDKFSRGEVNLQQALMGAGSIPMEQGGTYGSPYFRPYQGFDINPMYYGEMPQDLTPYQAGYTGGGYGRGSGSLADRIDEIGILTSGDGTNLNYKIDEEGLIASTLPGYAKPSDYYGKDKQDIPFVDAAATLLGLGDPDYEYYHTSLTPEQLEEALYQEAVNNKDMWASLLEYSMEDYKGEDVIHGRLLPDGSIMYADGRIERPDGTIENQQDSKKTIYGELLTDEG